MEIGRISKRDKYAKKEKSKVLYRKRKRHEDFSISEESSVDRRRNRDGGRRRRRNAYVKSSHSNSENEPEDSSGRRRRGRQYSVNDYDRTLEGKRKGCSSQTLNNLLDDSSDGSSRGKPKPRRIKSRNCFDKFEY